jgi:hypothetical protein
MATKNDYSAGTASIANGGTVVTGSGSMWVAADIQPGDTFKVQNLDAIILSVDSNTQVTLKEPWTGTTLSGSAYGIRYQPDGSRFTSALRDLVSLLGNGNLQALAGLTGAINKIPYFIGAGAMALADFKDWAVSFFSLSPAANKLAYFSGATTAALTDLTAAGRASLNITGTAAADKLPYLTSATAAALTDLTAQGRTALANITAAGNALIDDANASAQLTTLGISTFVKTLLDDANGAAFFATMGATGANTPGSAYTKLPNGMIIQAGTEPSGSTLRTIIYPLAFPTGGFPVVVPYYGGGAIPSSVVTVANAGGFAVANSVSSANFWVAIGY